MPERWLPIEGYEGFYEVSDKGRVRSVDRTIVNARGRRVRYKGRVLKQSITGEYMSVCLSKIGDAKPRSVHLLVLETFVGPRPGHPSQWHGCHNDGNWRNNNLSNLRWGTAQSNCQDAMEHGTHSRGERHGRSKLTEEEVSHIKYRFWQDPSDSNTSIARRYGVTHQTISLIRRGNTWDWVKPVNPDRKSQLEVSSRSR